MICIISKWPTYGVVSWLDITFISNTPSCTASSSVITAKQTELNQRSFPTQFQPISSIVNFPSPCLSREPHYRPRLCRQPPQRHYGPADRIFPRTISLRHFERDGITLASCSTDKTQRRISDCGLNQGCNMSRRGLNQGGMSRRICCLAALYKYHLGFWFSNKLTAQHAQTIYCSDCRCDGLVC